MSLTRYLPTPSDRMGILWTLLQIEDSVILEYGTAGTTAYAMKTFMMSGMNIQGKLFTTELSESELVMGEDARLENKIKELDKKLSPKVIFVMASSVSSVTGYDVEGVCRYLEKYVNTKLIVFPQGGFSGDFSYGLQVAYTKLIEKLSYKSIKQEDYFNILGVSALSSHVSGDISTLSNWMWEKFELKPHAILSFNTNLDKISTMSKAKINIVLSYEGLKGAKLLQERFGTPYVYGYPISCGGEEKFFLDIRNYIPEKKISKLKKLELYNKKESKIAVYAPYDILISIEEYAMEIGIPIEFLLCTHSLKEVENPSPKVLFCKTEKEKISLFNSLNNTIIIGDDTFYPHINKSNKILNLSIKGTNKQKLLLLNHENLLNIEKYQ